MVLGKLDIHMQKNENWTPILQNSEMLTWNGLKT